MHTDVHRSTEKESEKIEFITSVKDNGIINGGPEGVY